jgi:hypothetical protein
MDLALEEETIGCCEPIVNAHAPSQEIRRLHD